MNAPVRLADTADTAHDVCNVAPRWQSLVTAHPQKLGHEDIQKQNNIKLRFS